MVVLLTTEMGKSEEKSYYERLFTLGVAGVRGFDHSFGHRYRGVYSRLVSSLRWLMVILLCSFIVLCFFSYSHLVQAGAGGISRILVAPLVISKLM